jgi:hypothetical protein
MPMTATSPSPANFPWRGRETVEAARSAIARRDRIALQLPAGFHHAVYAHFRAHDLQAVAERLDVTGGAEVLQRLAQIEGLDGLAQLAADVANAHASVRLLSPTPTVIISCGATPANA